MRHAAITLAAVLNAVCLQAAETKPAGPAGRNIHRRGDLANARVQFSKNKTGHVAFIGGSITEMNGYRPMVCEMLRKRFPNTKFTFTDAGIASTCSTTGAFRLAEDVLSAGPVDLFFIEFAVNDDQDAGHARRECIRGMEGIVRHARLHNPCMDVVITYFVNPGMLQTLQEGKTPLTAGSHEEVARHYGVSTIDLAREVAERITDGQLTWKQFGGTHPAPLGNAICAKMIDDLLTAAWKGPLPADAARKPHPMPAEPLDALSYYRGRFIDPAIAKVKGGWKLAVPEWKKLKGSCRRRFLDATMLSAEKGAAELTLEFTGTAVGAYVLAGPDAGIVEATIDGGQPVKVDLYHRFSRGLHYPRTVMFAADLKPASHTLLLRTTDAHNPDSTACATRILKFVAN
ncbi:MAG: SGNH/GDSL hydrolase family protein [Phycisphaerae bacterium]